MLVDVIDVRPEDKYVLWLKFEDGTEGNVDIKELLGEFSGVFDKLNDIEFFRSVKVDSEIGTISWAGNVDLCPDVLYSAVKGLPKPDLSKIVSA